MNYSFNPQKSPSNAQRLAFLETQMQALLKKVEDLEQIVNAMDVDLYPIKSQPINQQHQPTFSFTPNPSLSLTQSKPNNFPSQFPSW